MRKQNWILIVEGSKGACSELVDVVQQLGFQVQICDECPRAHWLLLNQKFACVLIDQNVSGADGLNVISSVKKNRYHLNNKTPFILMGDCLESEVLSRMAGRIEGALVKPFVDSLFIEKVKSVVQTR